MIILDELLCPICARIGIRLPSLVCNLIDCLLQ